MCPPDAHTGTCRKAAQFSITVFSTKTQLCVVLTAQQCTAEGWQILDEAMVMLSISAFHFLSDQNGTA